MNKPRLNKYTCRKCRGSITTIDRDKGVTPFMLECRATPECGGNMYSHGYRGIAEKEKPTHEWYMPSDLSGLDEWTREHVENGGLLIRGIEQGGGAGE